MTMTNSSLTQGRKESLLIVTLLVSVILNLFFGVWEGFEPGVRGGRHFAPMSLASRHGDFTGESLMRYLTPADAAVFHDAMQPHLDALKQAHEHVHQAIRDVAAIYEQDQPDAAALQTALDRVKQAKADMQDVVNVIIQDSYTKLSADGRHRLADVAR
jgi:uncharacterized membrane protein